MYITQNSNNLLKNWKTSKIKTSASSQIHSEGCISCGVHQMSWKDCLAFDRVIELCSKCQCSLTGVQILSP